MQRRVNSGIPASKPDYVQLAQRMGARRLEKKESLREEIDAYLERLPGKRVLGKDADGSSCWTKEPHTLKIAHQDGGLVSIRFGLKFSRRGSRIIEGNSVSIHITDIYRAVRKARHVWEGMEADSERRDGLLRKTEIIHAHVSIHGKNYADADFDKRIASLGRIFKRVKKYSSKLNEEGKARFSEAMGLLVSAGNEKNAFVRARLISNSCAKLVAFGNDFGVWRESESNYTKMFNRLRERALRFERDARLKGALCKWERVLGGRLGWAAMEVWKKDAQFAKTTEELSEKLKLSEKQRARWLVAGIEKIGKSGEKGCAHINVPLAAENGKKHWIDAEMDSMGLAEQIELLRKGERFSAGMLGEEYWVKAAVLINAKRLAEQGYDEHRKGKYSIVQNLKEAYSILKSAGGDSWCAALKSASKEVELGSRVLLADNPFYVAAQLSVEPEIYLTLEKKKNASILKYVQEGAKLIGRGNPGRAAYCFGEAQKLL